MVPTVADARNDFPPALRIFLVTSGVLYLLAAISCVVARWRHLPPVYTSPLMPMATNFEDFLMFVQAMPHAGSLTFFHTGPRFAYPPAALVVYRLLFALPHPTTVCVLLILAATLLLVLRFEHALRLRGLGKTQAVLFSCLTAVLSFPLWFDLQRGNIEFVVFVLAAGGAWCFLRQTYGWAGALWGVAAAIKLFPIFLVALLLTRTRWRGTVTSAVAIVLSTLLGLRLANRDLLAAGREFVIGLVGFKSDYTEAVRPFETGLDHSLFVVIKQINVAFGGSMDHVLTVFLVAAGIACVVIWWAWLRALPALNQLVFGLAAMVTLMPTSMEYTLLHLYTSIVPLALVCVADLGTNDTSEASALMACFAVLTVPLTWVHWHGISYAGSVQCAALLLVMGLALRTPLAWSQTPRQFAVAGR